MSFMRVRPLFGLDEVPVSTGVALR